MSIEHGQSTLILREGSDSWTDRYSARLLGDLSAESATVVLADAADIARASSLAPDAEGWGSSRLRTGAVMGAVQSGKTASMVGVVAGALDRGTNVVVVLGGTRRALWLQTRERLAAQLDARVNAFQHRLWLPLEDATLVGEAQDLATLYQIGLGQARRALARDRPIIIVAMKQVDHLREVRRTLHDSVYPAAAALGTQVRLLVVDDEADDSSIADSPSADSPLTKQVPLRILDLWQSRQDDRSTVASHVFATYLGYTATPQANFLQDPQNPLAPRDFVAALRTPGPEGTLIPRSLTYRVTGGITAWYTGADIFYRRLADQLLVMEDESSIDDRSDDRARFDDEALIRAVRAYLVAAAVRLLRAPGRVGPRTAKPMTFQTAKAAQDVACAPSSMLIHPSPATQDHFAVADVLRAWWRGDGDHDSADGVIADLTTNPDAWQQWIASYAASSEAVYQDVDRHHDLEARPIPSWDSTLQTIVDELLPATRIAVINSDERADDRPRFGPVPDGDLWRAAPDLSTIFISGNVMARGLTLEGLLTTSFSRAASAPLADSQMQMQRWFGYRGAYIDLCRVFLTTSQRALFTEYADADQALRQQVLTATGVDGSLPDFAVLQGAAFRATGKVPGLRNLTLSPGRRPFIRLLNPPGRDDRNLELVREVFEGALESGHLVADRRGVLDHRPLSLSAAADLLDRLRYDDHGASRGEAARWRSYEHLAGISPDEDLAPLYRAPHVEGASLSLGQASPYTIAAYLRFWATSLDRRVRGLRTDESPSQQWSLLDLAIKRAQQPRFRVALRFGAGAVPASGPLAALSDALGSPVRSMAREVRDGFLVASWGSRGITDVGYSSDELFDYELSDTRRDLDSDGSRRPGSDGLILFHPVDRDEDRFSIAVGLSIPAGGPDLQQAITAARMDVDA